MGRAAPGMLLPPRGNLTLQAVGRSSARRPVPAVLLATVWLAVTVQSEPAGNIEGRNCEEGAMSPMEAAATVVLLRDGAEGAEVLLLDRNIAKLRTSDAIYQGHLQTVASNAYEVERAVVDADLVIGAVLVPGAKAPTLVSNELVSRMKPGSVLVDISIDQGGCFEDSRPTTHADPTYRVHDSLFYCVANMPGAVPHTSTYALTNVTLRYAIELANLGWSDALRGDRALGLGLNTHGGAVTYAPVAEAHGMASMTLDEALS